MSDFRFAAIVLAAGLSRRMGVFKPLLPLGDKPLIVCVVESLRAAESTFGSTLDVIVVTGHNRDMVEAALRDHGVRCAHNENFATGEMLSSVQTGVRALPDNADAFLLALGDQPLIHPNTLQQLMHHAASAKIVIPTFNGKRGHPVLFARDCVAEILALSLGDTLKTVVRRHACEIAEVPVDDESIVWDIDTPADYERALRQWSQRDH